MIGDLIAGLFGKVLDKAFPDANQKAEMALELAKMQQAGEFKELDAALAQMQMQADINKIEAADPSLLKSGWRPMSGWVCVATFAWNWLLMPIAGFVFEVMGRHVVLQPADLTLTMPLFLGLAGLRAYERVKDKA